MRLGDDFYDRPVHGPDGRTAFVRRLLGLRQADFAAEIGASRETVSHWENLLPDGRPRARVSRRYAMAVAELVRKRIGTHVPAGVFFDADETALDGVLIELRAVREELESLRAEVGELSSMGVLRRPLVASWEGSQDELLDAEGAAALLTVKATTLLAWAREGRVRSIRLGPRAVRWTRPLLREIRDGAAWRDVH
jgi:DNA-binding XRE family transcriptional regulator